MKALKDVILEKLSVNNISFDNLSDELKSKYNLVYNPRTEKYDCDCDIRVENDLIENGHFICNFGVVIGNFDCNKSSELKFLRGAPEKVGGYFRCDCLRLETLEGAPKEVGESFWCDHCNDLKSLKGAPIKVDGSFWCNHCKDLESLDGAPEKVGGTFYCSDCENLKSLNGAPEKVGGHFKCSECPKLTNYTISTKIGGLFIK